MKDYFAEFLLNPNTTSRLKNLSGLGDNSSVPLKLHIAWALAAAVVGLVSWKASKIYSGYLHSQPKAD